MGTSDERDARRSAIESEHNSARDAIEKQYIADKNALEDTYQEALRANANDKRAAFVAEGLNPDGGDPQGRPQGSAV